MMNIYQFPGLVLKWLSLQFIVIFSVLVLNLGQAIYHGTRHCCAPHHTYVPSNQLCYAVPFFMEASEFWLSRHLVKPNVTNV
jgi:hypothetical protein